MAADPVQHYDSSNAPENHMDIWLDLVGGLRSHLLFIGLVFLATVASTYLVLQVKTDLYETGASLLVKLGRENLEAPATVEKGSMVNTVGVRTEDIYTEISLLVSRPLIESTVDSIGLEPFLAEAPPPEGFFKRIKYQIKQTAKAMKAQLDEVLVFLNLRTRLDDREHIIKGLLSAIEAVPGKESDVINVYMRSPNPALAEQVLSTLLDQYLKRRVAVRGNQNIYSFFEEQVASYRQQIKNAEREREQLLAETGVSSIPVQRELLLKRLHRIYTELEAYKSQLYLLTANGTVEPSVADNPLVAESGPAQELQLEPLKQRLSELRIRRLELLKTYAAAAEPVSTLDQEISAVEVRILVSLRAMVSKHYERARYLEEKLAALNDAEISLESLQREQKLAEQNYLIYDKRKEEARISEELDRRRVGNISIMVPVSSSFEPVSPRKLLITVISIPVGLLLGIALALLLEYLNDTVRSYRDLLRIPGTSYLGEFRRG